MTRNELIGAVAARYLQDQLNTEPSGIVRFCLIRLERSLVSSIARAVLDHPALQDQIEIHIPSPLAEPGVLPEAVISDEAAAHWRHSPPVDPARRAVLFAVTDREAEQIGRTLGDLPQLDTDHLRMMQKDWLSAAGITKDTFPLSEIKQFIAALKGLEESSLSVNIKCYADYVLAVANALDKGKTIIAALDYALPALRMPRNAGTFSSIPEKKRTHKAEWKRAFNKIEREIRPYLYKVLPKKEEPIDPEKLTQETDRVLRENPHLFSSSEVQLLRDFIQAPLRADRWVTIQGQLCELLWSDVAMIFKELTRTRQNLWSETRAWFDHSYPALLEPGDVNYLDYCIEHPKKGPEEEDINFFHAHNGILDENKPLYKKWERFIYKNPREYDDFLVGLFAAVFRLLQLESKAGPCTSWSLAVRIPKADAEGGWENTNRLAARYFAQRYQGIEQFFDERVRIDFGRLNELFLGPDHHHYGTDSTAKDKLRIRFEVTLYGDNGSEAGKHIFYWATKANTVAGALCDDLHRLLSRAESVLDIPYSEIARQSIGAKGRLQQLTLGDINSFYDVDRENSGRLVSPKGAGKSLTQDFLTILDQLHSDNVMAPNAARVLSAAFHEFLADYRSALADWTNPEGAGLSSPKMMAQAKKYGALLKLLRDKALENRCRTQLWPIALKIGVAQVGKDDRSAIIAPWHPLRLLELHVKARQTADHITKLLGQDPQDYQKADLFLSDTLRALAAPYYPEVCIGFDSERHHILTASENLHGYTLAEYPFHDISQREDGALDEKPDEAAKRLADICGQYLDLLPHERANFSVLLFNAESKGLPGAVANALSRRVQEDEGLRCDLLLTHTDKALERKIYREQNVAADDDASLVFASEAAKNFMSRLRIGFIAAPDTHSTNASRPVDVVFLQDVVARNAKCKWFEAPYEKHAVLMEHSPPDWSRRKPQGKGDDRSVVYLAAPLQPACGAAYLDLLYGAVEDDELQPGRHYLPARVVDFRDTDIRKIITDTHNQGDWVVSYDALTDRRLLEDNNINVIRHLHDPRTGRNLVISTTADQLLLHTLVTRRLKNLHTALTDAQLDAAARSFIETATKVSGHLIMRAARYGKFANELLGVVLSQQLILEELNVSTEQIGWFFLDDYAVWLGQKEERIADLLAVAPTVEDGCPVVKLVVSEAKYVTSTGHSSHALKSARQLHDTVKRLATAFDPEQNRVDRKLWLSRLSEMMLEGMSPFGDEAPYGWDLDRWALEVKHDSVEIRVLGHSHVFVHDTEQPVDDESRQDRDLLCCSQDLIGPTTVSHLVEAFALKKPLSDYMPVEFKGTVWDFAVRSKPQRPEGNETKPVPDGREGKVAPPSPKETDDSAASVAANDSKQEAKEAIGQPRPSRSPSEGLDEWIRARCQAKAETSEEDMQWLDSTVDGLRRALTGYGMRAVVRDKRLTPNAALIHLQGSDQLTIPQIEKRRGELKTSHGLDVINIQPGLGKISVSVARPRREILSLAEIWAQRKINREPDGSNLSLILGAREQDGEIQYLNIRSGFEGQSQHAPHTLIAGTSGSGKSVLVQNLLLDIGRTNPPDLARIHLIDPKMGLDYQWLTQLPHLDGEVVTEQGDAIAKLEFLTAEMERRYNLFKEVSGANNLAAFNRKVEPEDRLPVLWLFHDEFADWMVVDEYKDAAQTAVKRLGVKARAAGIHLVFIAQRPDSSVFPMQLRDNLGNRLVLRVPNAGTSEIALGEKGAERLLGRGHLAARLEGETGLIYIQVPFLAMEDIEEVAELIRQYWETNQDARPVEKMRA